MSAPLTDLMRNFVNKKSLFEVSDGVQVLKPVHSLVQLNLNKKESLKSKSFIDVGTHAKLLLEGIADDEKVKGFRSLCFKSYVTATTYLQQNLPFNNKIIDMHNTYIQRKEIIPWQKMVSQILHSNWPRCLERNHKQYLKPLPHRARLSTL